MPPLPFVTCMVVVGQLYFLFILLYSFPESCLLILQNNTMFFSVHVFSFQNDSKKRQSYIIIMNAQSRIYAIRGATGSDEPWPAEQPPLAVFPDCTRRYWVDVWSAH
jgi:hypothetical protein